MFEHKNSDILPTSRFISRVLKYFGYSILLVAFALLVGVLGYHFFANLDWIDSFYNASMILTGMGPAAEMITTQAKLFSSFYALFSGIAFLSMATVLVAPIAHRSLHTFHLDNYESK